jgi:hypothetical protein
MAILIRSGRTKWQPAQKLEFREETHLQQLLYESPDLIVTREEERPAIFMREAGLPGSGFTDLVGVDSLGNILVVETKLAKNQEIRRKVIGQVLEYAAFLWQMPYDRFDELFKNREGKSIAELFSEKADSVPAEEEVKRTIRITENLVRGKFKLLIAVDAINPELEKIIAYLSNFRSGFTLEALEINIYQQGDMEVFVPQRHGQVSPPESVGGTRTIEDVIASAPDEHARHLYELLVEEWQKLGHEVVPGTAGASFKAEINGSEQPIFWAFPTYLQPVLGGLNKRGIPPSLLASYREALAAIPGFDKKRMMSDYRPTIELSSVSVAEIQSFIKASGNLVQGWRGAAQQ